MALAKIPEVPPNRRVVLVNDIEPFVVDGARPSRECNIARRGVQAGQSE